MIITSLEMSAIMLKNGQEMSCISEPLDNFHEILETGEISDSSRRLSTSFSDVFARGSKISCIGHRAVRSGKPPWNEKCRIFLSPRNNIGRDRKL